MPITINPVFVALCGFCFTLLSALVGIGIFWGSMKAQIKALFDAIERLEKKQEKHNNLIERMVVVEQSAKAAHHRLDKIPQARGK